MSEKGVIGICGSGLIGKGWAMLFVSAGFRVNLFDSNQSQTKNAIADIEKQLRLLEKKNLLRGSLSVKEQISLIKDVTSLNECVKGARHIQECIPESIDLKRKLFLELDAIVEKDTVLASSSSSIAPSLFTADLIHKNNCLINHPINPPYHVRLIEIVPAPWTSAEAVARTRSLMEEIGQAPVSFLREVLGFGVNRIQLAILNECWHLVTNGVLSAPDVDLLMSEGLGMRYAFQGPFETAHLLANGIENSIKHFGPSFLAIGKTLESTPSWSTEDGAKIIEQMNKNFPLDKLEERRKWRDERLVELSKLKENMKKTSDGSS